MVIRDFFNTDLTIGNDNVELSDNVDDLSLAYPDGWSDAYWYGWLKWENIPDCIKLSSVECTGSNKDRTITATSIPEQNLNVGYMATGFTAPYAYWYGAINGQQPYTNNNNIFEDPISSTSPLMGSRFINKLDPRGICPIHGGATASAENCIIFCVQIQRIYGDDNDGYNFFSFIRVSFDDTPNGINKFLNGEITRRIQLTNFKVADDMGYVTGTYNFDYILDVNSADFNSEHRNVWTHRFSLSGYNFISHAFMIGFGYPVGRDKIDETTLYTNDTLRITPITSQIIDNKKYVAVGAQNYSNYLVYNNVNTEIPESGAYNISNSQTLNSIDGYNYGGFLGTVTLAGNGTNCYGISFSDDANFAVSIETQYPTHTISKIRVLRIMSIEEIQHVATLNMRFVVNDDYLTSSYGFGTGIYYPRISANNEYLCEWITGDFDDIKDQLKPWQYKNIRDNTYDPNQPEPSGANNFYFGENQIQLLYYGENEVQSLYYGPYLIFPTTPPAPSNPYTEISYIEATGTQYINTGYTQQSNSLRIKMTVRPAFMGNTGKLIAAPNFGLKVVWYGTIQGRFYGINFYVNDSALFSGGIWHDPQSYFTEVEAILNPTTAQLLQDSGTSGSGAGSDASISASSPYCIFSEAGQELLQCQLSACQIYDNEVLVRDFIPVLRNSDNKPGLLDRVNNQFYTNAGTGEFIYQE